MRYYIEAYDENGSQVLGNLDGQASFDCIRPERTSIVKRLQQEPRRKLSLHGRVAIYKVVDRNGKVVLTIAK